VISLLVLTNVRQLIMDAIPMDLKRAIAIGIGLFLAIIGFVTGGVVVQGEGTPITIVPDLTTLRMATFVFGLVVSASLVARGLRGGLLIGIVATTVFGIVLNEVWGGGLIWEAVGPGVAQWPADVVSSPDFGLVGNFDFGVFSVLSLTTALVAILSVMLADFFDTMGTAVGLGEEAGLLDEDGRLPGIKRVLLVDGLAAAAGGAVSSSSNTTFIESGSGIADGGRTGLASVVTGALFLLCLFISPLAGVVPPEATAPILVIVGYMMMKGVGEIDWRDPGIGIPAFLTMTVMPFTYNIAHGIAAGFLSYTLIRIAQGRAREVHWLLYAVDVLFVVYFARGLLA
jgi:AGZA family xanthine/uracil permease-like MFS transporter